MLAIAFSAAPAFAPAAAFPATRTVQHAAVVRMDETDTFAPVGMGAEFVSKPRKPLSEYVGASHELAAFPGGEMKAWDPLDFALLYKVSGNNPDVAFLREAELKHGRLAMLAFAGLLVTNGGVHLPGDLFTDSNWVTAPASVNAKAPAAIAQIFAAIAIIEGQTSKGVFDLWFGVTDKREPGDIGFDPLKLMPTTKEAADKMRLKELKNGRMAMLAIMGFAANHFLPGSAPGLQGFAP